MAFTFLTNELPLQSLRVDGKDAMLPIFPPPVFAGRLLRRRYRYSKAN